MTPGAMRMPQKRARGMTDMGNTNISSVENFSLTRGGPFHSLLVRLGHAGDERQRVIRRALIATLVTWLPLFLLAVVQGLAYDPHIKISLLKDFAVNVRSLIAVPILILAESGIDRRWRALVLEFLRSGLVDEKELPSFEMVINKITSLRDRVCIFCCPLFAREKTDVIVMKNRDRITSPLPSSEAK
jgi:hypothetical protein